MWYVYIFFEKRGDIAHVHPMCRVFLETEYQVGGDADLAAAAVPEYSVAGFGCIDGENVDGGMLIKKYFSKAR